MPCETEFNNRAIRRDRLTSYTRRASISSQDGHRKVGFYARGAAAVECIAGAAPRKLKPNGRKDEGSEVSRGEGSPG